MAQRKFTNDLADEQGLVPAGTFGPYLPISDSDVDTFNDILGDEIDSVFSSTICCCDFCYEDFKKHWPEVTFRKVEFQTQSIEARWFFETSRVAELYSSAEISTLRHCIRCPRCGRFDSWYLWLYEHLFSGAEAIESAIDELLELGSKTPFLMLEHPFAVRVLEQIRSLAVVATSQKLNSPLYRARLANDVCLNKQNPAELGTFGPPPSAVVSEGRFNHAGHPMLYAASSAAVAAAELGQPGELSYVAELSIGSELTILDLVDIEEGAEGFELLEALASSALLLAPNVGKGWMKRQYVFSRFVADCAISAGFDAIRFGSTKLAKGSNIVILEPPQELSTLACLVGVSELVCGEPDRRY